MKVTREQLIHSAIRLFRAEGFQNVTVEKICEACGVTKGSFYHHFQSKDDIILQYWNATYLSNSDQAMKILTEETSPKEKLWKMLELGIDSAIEDIGRNSMAELWRVDLAQGNTVLCAESFLNGPTLSPRYSEVLEELIRQAQNNGEISCPASPRNLLFTFYSALFGASVNWSMRKEENDVKADLVTVFSVIFH